MNIIQNYVSVLKKYVEFKGRASRAEYWYFVLVNSIVSVILSMVFGLLGLNFVIYIYLLAVMLPSISVGVRRMHDVGKSGWFLLIPFYSFYLFIIKGEERENQYGPVPID